MFRWLFFPLLLLTPFGVMLAQRYDCVWVSGYEGGDLSPNDDQFGLSILDFSDGSLRISNNQESALEFYITALSMADAEGRLIFYTNGIDIENADWQPMQNGNGIHAPVLGGLTISQGALALPFPGRPDQYALLHVRRAYIPPPVSTIGVLELKYSLLDLSQNSGLGAVIEKNTTLLADTLQFGKLTAVRHANGRDWWLLVAEAWSNRFYRILFDPAGFHVLDAQTIGETLFPGVGQAVFSADGSKYVVYDTYQFGTPDAVDVYDFDRCSGLLSNHRRFSTTSNLLAGGVSISPNSRYLYVHTTFQVSQFDLNAADIAESRVDVATYDGYESPFPTHFFAGRLAPDGKIYICTSNGTDVLHVIHQPDEAGAACMLEQHGIRLPTYNASSMNNLPSYRLGPMDGSACDTLGIDNLPRAWWRSEQDTLDMLAVSFHDLSYYEPAQWRWDFGDGSALSNLRNPEHHFPEEGVYEVCLTVSNGFGEDTFCKTIQLGVSASVEPDGQSQLQLSPNPFSNFLSVTLNKALSAPQLRLYDQTGRRVLEKQLERGVNVMNTSELDAGFYFWELSTARGIAGRGRVVLAR